MLTTFWLNLPYMTRHSDEFLPKGRKHLVSEKNTLLYAKWTQPEAYEEACGSWARKRFPTLVKITFWVSAYDLSAIISALSLTVLYYGQKVVSIYFCTFLPQVKR